MCLFSEQGEEAGGPGLGCAGVLGPRVGKIWEQTSSWGAEGVSSLLHTETHAPNTDSSVGWGRLLLGKCSWLWCSLRGPGWASDERRRIWLLPAGSSLSKEAGKGNWPVPFQVSWVQSDVLTVPQDLLSVTMEWKGAKFKAKPYSGEKTEYI